MIKLKFILLLILLPFLAIDASSQNALKDSSSMRLTARNPEGTEFWLCFMKNYKEPEAKSSLANELHLELFITGDKDAQVSVEIESIGYKKKVFLQGGTVKSIKIDPLAQILSNEVIEHKHAVKITSDNPISVYGLNRRFQTTDTYLGLPTRVLGNEYRVTCYNISDGLMPQFAIVATENDTYVSITTTAETENFPAGQTYNITLNAGDVYQVASKFIPASKCDLTGSYIKADKKIAVFSGHQCAYVPPRVIACNHLVEQMPPIPSWGKHFYLGKFKRRSYYTYRVVANEPKTRVFEDNKLMKTLSEGEFFERTLNRNAQVTADKPILVAQYSQGFKNGDSIGDPMMILISPTQQFLKKYRFATPVNGSWNHYVNVVVPSNSIKSIRLNNARIDSNLFEPLGLSRYSLGIIEVPFGTHVLEGAEPFGMYSYGFGFAADAYDAYGTMGGQSFLAYEAMPDTLPPMAEAVYEDNLMKIIFRDDRIDDSGIRSIDIVISEGIEPYIPTIDEGIPQLSMALKPQSTNVAGRMTVIATDVAMNEAPFTICYAYDTKTDQYIFSITEGLEADCELDPGFQIGAFGKISALMHSTSFGSTDGLKTNGLFGDATGSGGYGGLIIGRRWDSQLLFSGRLSFENYGGILTAPDTTFSRIRLNDGTLDSLQEAYDLSAKGTFLNIAAAAEWYPRDYFYFLGGLNFSFTLSKSVEIQKHIVRPDNYAYDAEGSRSIKPADAPESLSSMNTLRFGLFGGFGITLPIARRVSGFAEGVYTYNFSSLISDGSWNIHQLSVIIGFRYRI